MILENKNFDKKYLVDYDSCTLLQGNDNFYYQNCRIVRNNGLYKYIGVTHEYLSTPNNNKVLQFDKNVLFIRDIGDGGSKSDKFERDIRLLTDGIKEEPNNDRYHFYLANSYHDHGDFEKAIEIYQKRIKLGGWDQEVWYSYYRIGLCYKNMGQIEKAIYSWLAAYNHLPIRIENLYEIINHYRIIGNHKLALHFYHLALEILNKKNYNKDQFLFLHNDVYTYKLFYEYTIFSAYVGNKNINDEIIQVLNNSTDQSINKNLFSNMKFYNLPLDLPLEKVEPNFIKTKVINFDNKIDILVNNEMITFYSSSSCLIPFKEEKERVKYLMNIRYVNYTITENGSYIGCDKNIITANKLVKLNKDFKIIEERFFDIHFEDRKYIGIEDIRIFQPLQNIKDFEKVLVEEDLALPFLKVEKVEFIGTGYHKNNTIGIVVGDYNLLEVDLKSIEITQNFNKSSCEKNWVFVNYENSTSIIYSWYPLQILPFKKVEPNHQLSLDLPLKKVEPNHPLPFLKVDLKETKQMPKIFSHVRGSTCGFNYKSEIWFICHLVSYENPRHYYHIFVIFDNSINLLRYSAPFKFEGKPIEYCLSIVVEDEQVLINYSCWDRTTKIGIYDKKYIDSIIKYT